MVGGDRVRETNSATGVLVLADGTVFGGTGFGATGEAAGELCYHTAMAGFQEIMSDPAFAGQIVNFTFPHVGNTGANHWDEQGQTIRALGCVVGEEVTAPSNYRAKQGFADWMEQNGQIGVAGIDTRAVMRRLRAKGVMGAVVAHAARPGFDIDALVAKAQAAPGLDGRELARDAGVRVATPFGETAWTAALENPEVAPAADAPHVVAIDYGGRRDALRQLVAAGARVTVVPASVDPAALAQQEADALFLSSGPGDPRETAQYALPAIKDWLASGKPLLATGLGYHLLALALGAHIVSTPRGHYGFNHPVRDLATGQVDITDMRERFVVEQGSVPPPACVTHTSLFDQSIAGIALEGAPVSGVQYHPESGAREGDVHPMFHAFLTSVHAS